MKEPIFVRSLTASEEATLRGSLHASEACTLRRSPILLASAESNTLRQIARQVGCTDQTVRNVIRAVESLRDTCPEACFVLVASVAEEDGGQQVYPQESQCLGPILLYGQCGQVSASGVQ